MEPIASLAVSDDGCFRSRPSGQGPSLSTEQRESLWEVQGISMCLPPKVEDLKRHQTYSPFSGKQVSIAAHPQKAGSVVMRARTVARRSNSMTFPGTGTSQICLFHGRICFPAQNEKMQPTVVQYTKFSPDRAFGDCR